jgi:17beta-estradiol 17-dehydrogenase / very-long-chain 3-oxoacyl-CoA reductase
VSLLVFFFVLKTLFTLLSFVYTYFIRPGKNLKKYGSWAIVTGCTDGIGKAICEEFAKLGINLVLISRTKQKLDEQAKELQEKFKIDTRVVPLDFSVEDPSVFNSVKSTIENLDIGILVNNVGASYDHAEYFDQLDRAKINQLIRLNIYSTVEMTYLVLPGMLQRKRGAIINVSSASSLVSEPMYAVYSGTKAFVNSFSIALHHENKSRGVHVQTQLPAFVTTKLSKLRSTSFFICSPKVYAKEFLRQIGYDSLILSYWTHALQFLFLPLVPAGVLASFLLSRGKDIRQRALKKKAQ